MRGGELKRMYALGEGGIYRRGKIYYSLECELHKDEDFFFFFYPLCICLSKYLLNELNWEKRAEKNIWHKGPRA